MDTDVVYLSATVDAADQSPPERVLQPATDALVSLIRKHTSQEAGEEEESPLLYSVYYKDTAPTHLSLDGQPAPSQTEQRHWLPPMTELSDEATNEAWRLFKIITERNEWFQKEGEGDEEQA